MDITDHQTVTKSTAPAFPVPTQVSQSAVVKPMLEKLDADRIIKTVQALADSKTRYYQTEQAELAADWIMAQYVTKAAEHGRTDISSRFHVHAWVQNSVITRIEGSGPRKDEIVVIGSHIDSINPSDLYGLNAPGADDDASGTATVLEVYRALLESGFKPDRTVEFHGYSAEEVGLRGSQDVVADYVKANAPVASMMQLDMTLYQPTAVNKIALVTDFVSSDLTAFLRTLVDTYCAVPWEDTKCGYACSDHASWNRAGYVSSFPFESKFNEINPAIHTKSDLVSKLNKDHGIEYAKLGLAYIVELAGTA